MPSWRYWRYARRNQRQPIGVEMNEDNPMSDESDDEDDNYDLGPIPDLKVAVEQRKERIAELEQGDAGDRRLAALLAKCRKYRRCDLVECAVCERRKLVARRGIPASVIKLIGWLNPMLHIGVRAIKVKGDRRALNPEKVIASLPRWRKSVCKRRLRCMNRKTK